MTQKIELFRPDLLCPSRRQTIEVRVGNQVIGGDNPILVQSMVNTSTKDVDATVMQTLELAEAGCQMVRITAPTAKDAELLGVIHKRVREAGCDIPLSADIHFQPKAAFEALKWVEKVRINPGNFVDQGIMSNREWTDEDFERGAQKVYDTFAPLVREAKERGVALRIGTNHGSLSARMLYRFGDTVEGMVESALEYLRVCESEDFDQIVFSMKASNPRIAMEAYRLLALRLDNEHKPYPFHVGVTEAGDGMDARLKSAVGIGSLLLDGIGDTIRVSLTEHPVAEVPVAQQLIAQAAPEKVCYSADRIPTFNPYEYQRRLTREIHVGEIPVGGSHIVSVGAAKPSDNTPVRQAEWYDSSLRRISAKDILEANLEIGDRPLEIFVEHPEQLSDLENLDKGDQPCVWSYTGQHPLTGYRTLWRFLQDHFPEDPILIRAKVSQAQQLYHTAWIGSLLCDGVGDMVAISDTEGNGMPEFTFDVLQAAGVRKTKTEFVACPSCGRTLFDLEEVLAKVRERTGHLKELSIAVMGCIVNGPGEMADADFGYVGGAPGKISLYEGKTLVKKNIPQASALDELEELLKSRGVWTDPPSVT